MASTRFQTRAHTPVGFIDYLFLLLLTGYRIWKYGFGISI